ncbi:mannose-P-dolichol utilization defect 1 protein [Gymnopilus junonius]|uniref:Mannose-P-dolichol utilization defect 1 protein n=1 Tax=Gymnopilus junonius TaxID=109634 RepID=A0A9P5TGL6_GYMJU|nr:mannose-P-dolichol utilization defect 1 protein [Gymnopilus junonius]
MTAITRNLPWFIKDLGVSIVGDDCYTSLVENLDIADVKCLKYSLSKGLGIGIVVGGSIMKVPQILLIVNARSARGLSLEAYILETLSYAITLAYSFRNQFPFSTYGENLFLTLQNVLITLLIIAYAPSRRGAQKSQTISLAAVGAITSGFALYAVPPSALSFLQMTTLPLSLFSKLPQIRQNYRSRSTGQLSAFAVISQIAGCLARLFTTATEVGDALVSAGFALALILNLVLGAQLWLYWGDKDATEEVGLKQVPHYQKGKEAGYLSPASAAAATPQVYQPTATTGTSTSTSTATHRVSTPPPRAQTPTSAGGRKWARKVD